ncbi:28S ribosomal protein S14 [Mactra antiquata]
MNQLIKTFSNLLKNSTSIQLSIVRTEYSWPGYGSRYGFTSWKMKKDFCKRQIVKEGFPQRMRLNAIRKNTILPQELREVADKEVAELPRNSNPIRLVNRCSITGRARGTKTRYRVSRIMYRHFVDYNKMSGVKRACW